jgi:serine/threonine protein kinase
VKVLDFGLAKALQDEMALVSSSVSQSPTLSLAATGAGIIIGTAGYMSPEQARGRPVDRRADIWAFGVVLFEMLSARPVFAGETVTDTFAHLLEREPDWSQLPPRTPTALRKLLQRCLVKNPKDRLQAIGDARTMLEELIADPAAQAITVEGPVYSLWKKLLPWAVAPLFLATGFFLRPSPAPPDRTLSQFVLPLPDIWIFDPARGTEDRVTYEGQNAFPIWSPDGSRMAFRSDRSGPLRIYVTQAANPQEVVELTSGPVDVPSSWTPDGKELAITRGFVPHQPNLDYKHILQTQ